MAIFPALQKLTHMMTMMMTPLKYFKSPLRRWASHERRKSGGANGQDHIHHIQHFNFFSTSFVISKSDHCGCSDRISGKLSPRDHFLPETKFPED